MLFCMCELHDKCEQCCCLHVWENDRTISKALLNTRKKAQVVKKPFVGGRFDFYFKELLPDYEDEI